MTPIQAQELILSGKAPSGMVVGGSLMLGRSTYLKSLPNYLKVGGWLDLIGCTSLQSLPENLVVKKQGLDLTGCTSLQSLPNYLKVGGWLDIAGCISLQLPYGIPVGVKGMVYADEEVLRNNKEHLFTMTNVKFDDMEMYKRILSE